MASQILATLEEEFLLRDLRKLFEDAHDYPLDPRVALKYAVRKWGWSILGGYGGQ